MGVFSFASLKGGVGKTSLSVNISHAFAQRGCRVLLVDIDPAGHSTNFFLPAKKPRQASPLARVLLSKDKVQVTYTGESFEPVFDDPLVRPARAYFDILPSGKELSHLLWGKGAMTFRTFFPTLIEELKESYDHIIIDTPPDYNVLTRTAIACSDIVSVPVDSSRMSIDSLEEIVSSAQHVKGPTWTIVRTMITKQASRVQKLSYERMQSNLQLESINSVGGEDDIPEHFEDSETFMEMLHEREHELHLSDTGDTSPIYLLDSLITRTEQQNRLSFLGKTAFDNRATRVLAEQYIHVAKELEDCLALSSSVEGSIELGEPYNHKTELRV